MRLVVLVVLLALAVTSPAQAHQRHRMTFKFAVMVADQYWANRGVFVPCHPRQELLTWRETKDWGYTPDMIADPAVCGIEVTPWAEVWRTDPDVADYYCKEIAHEIGHLAGLGHDYGGVMDPAENIVPWGCDHPRRFLKARARQSVLVPLF